MTDAGYEWFKKVCLYAKHVPDGAQRREVAEFWITVFHSKVLHEAKEKCRHAYGKRPCHHCIAKAFEEMADDTREMP